MQQAYEVSTPALDSDRDRWESKELPLLDDRHKKKYQALVGSLLYLMHATRPDIAYTVIHLSQYSTSPRSPHWDSLKRVLRYLKGTKDAVLALGGGRTMDNLLAGYFDAAHQYCYPQIYLWILISVERFSHFLVFPGSANSSPKYHRGRVYGWDGSDKGSCLDHGPAGTTMHKTGNLYTEGRQSRVVSSCRCWYWWS